ncbi:uroporphyrinogen-III synthase [Flexibacterium corallicola]|uniref:uroporphyrinogen-III synthase n=1 Tax=Flexibacterium corallicola TaxID=3037259 RepID=UPI00286F6E4D|nr:uroporphyrinogen-III synthase [Pseudovibrio sp. M1P-2-3]
MELLVTRAEPQATQTAQRLQALGHSVTVAPMLECEVLLVPDEPLHHAGAVVFTSSRAVEALTGQPLLDTLIGLPAFTVGDKTAEAAKASGFSDVRSASGTLEELKTTIKQAKLQGELMYLAGQERSGDLLGDLEPFGIKGQILEVYRMRAAASLPDEILLKLRSGVVDGVLLYSLRTAEVFMRCVEHENATESLNSMIAFSLSSKCKSVLGAFHHVMVARTPTESALFDLTLRKSEL